MRTINKIVIQPNTPNDNKVLWLNKNNASYYNNGTWVTIAATDGASTAINVTYNNDSSGLNAENTQDAIDELVAKNKSQDATIAAKAEKSDVQSSVSELKAKNTLQDAEIAKKANSADVTSQMQAEQSRVNTELGKKFDKESILQESGDAEDKVMSQKVISENLLDMVDFNGLPVPCDEIKNGAFNNSGFASDGINARYDTKFYDVTKLPSTIHIKIEEFGSGFQSL